MEEEWMRDRALLRDLLKKTPHASPRELAQVTGRSVSWVKKWRKRLQDGDPHDHELLCSRSRAHHAPYFRWDPRVEACIVEMRLSPPEHLGRTPGPRALLYYLPRDPALQAAGVRLPRSSRTVWKLLRKNGCILLKPPRKRRPTEPREPLEEIQMDFKDVSSVSASTKPGIRKRQHVIEVCNFVDAGTSIALFAQAREDFHEQTAMEAVIIFLQTYGRPRQMTFDRDPRLRLVAVLGEIFLLPCAVSCSVWGSSPTSVPRIGQTRTPMSKGTIEPMARSAYSSIGQQHCRRCVRSPMPSSSITTTSGLERRRACGNVPPRVAFPSLPTLPALPERVDPDRWLAIFDHQAYLRRVGRDGCESARSGNLLYRSAHGGVPGALAGGRKRCAVCCLACGSGHQDAPYQGACWARDDHR